MKLLLEAGYPVARDPRAIESAMLLREMDAEASTQNQPIGFATEMSSVRLRLVLVLIQYAHRGGLNPDLPCHRFWQLKAPDLTCKVLHVAPPTLAVWLLDHGAKPNCLDSDGFTPLDYLLKDRFVQAGDETRSMVVVYELYRLLISRGGRRTLSCFYWDRALEAFALLELQGLLSPRWSWELRAQDYGNEGLSGLQLYDLVPPGTTFDPSELLAEYEAKKGL